MPQWLLDHWIHLQILCWGFLLTCKIPFVPWESLGYSHLLNPVTLSHKAKPQVFFKMNSFSHCWLFCACFCFVLVFYVIRRFTLVNSLLVESEDPETSCCCSLFSDKQSILALFVVLRLYIFVNTAHGSFYFRWIYCISVMLDFI